MIIGKGVQEKLDEFKIGNALVVPFFRLHKRLQAEEEVRCEGRYVTSRLTS